MTKIKIKTFAQAVKDCKAELCSLPVGQERYVYRDMLTNNLVGLHYYLLDRKFLLQDNGDYIEVR